MSDRRAEILHRMRGTDPYGVMTDEMLSRGLGGVAVAGDRAEQTAKRRFILWLAALFIIGTGLFFVIF